MKSSMPIPSICMTVFREETTPSRTPIQANYSVSSSLSGDAGLMYGASDGGNDTIAVTNSGTGTRANVYGDAFEMYDITMGGERYSPPAILVTLRPGHSYGDAYKMKNGAQGGNDFINVTNSGYFSDADVFGDALSMFDNAKGGNDVLTVTHSGGNSAPSLVGDAGELLGNARGGDDILTSNGSGSLMHGDAGVLYDNAKGGNDVLNGGIGNDTLVGDAALYYPSSPGSITGGMDFLNGGAGNDQLWGGPNNDTFVFKAGSGNDVINDFDSGNLAVGSTAPEHDVINVHDYGFASWAALLSVTSDDSSGNAVIHLSSDDAITLVGVHTAALNSTDFRDPSGTVLQNRGRRPARCGVGQCSKVNRQRLCIFDPGFHHATILADRPARRAGFSFGRPARQGRAVMPGSEDAGQSLNLQRCRDGSRS